KVNGVTQFPYVPANADGSYTGDAQNLPGGVGPQKNDSLWVDIGLPAFTWNGRRIKPLVAPLILCLDGRLNLSAHGNKMDGGAHGSMAGFGPWETSLLKAMLPNPNTNVNEAIPIVVGRGDPRTATGVTSRAFNRFSTPMPIPGYSAVAWGGAGMGGYNSFLLPGGGSSNFYVVAPVYDFL